MDLIEDIKNKLNIVDVIGSYVSLKKTGANFKALSPFTQEKTPSFVVSPQKQIFHCFSTGKGGDMFTFIQEYEGVSFSEALQILADKAGLKLENYRSFGKIKNYTPDKDLKTEFFRAHLLATEFFEKNLWHTSEGAEVLQYLKNRGLAESTIREFRLGFAFDSFDALTPYLLEQGVTKKTLIASGFSSVKNIGDTVLFDKLRGRLMIPIFDYFGRICGFGARAMHDDQQPKYLNSPENLVYNKSKILFGLYQAKQFVKEFKEILIVEGYFDVMALWQDGLRNVVATSGTAFTTDQAQIIKRLTDRVVTCFDSDKAGFEATKRAYSVIQHLGMQLKVCEGVGEKDPADFVFRHPQEFVFLIQKSRDFLFFYLDALLAKNDVQKIEGRREVMTEIFPFLKKLPGGLADLYVRHLAKAMRLDPRFVHEDLQKYELTKEFVGKTESFEVKNDVDFANSFVQNKKFSGAEVLLSFLCVDSRRFNFLFEYLREDDFVEDFKSIYKLLLEHYSASADFSVDFVFEKEELKKSWELLFLYFQDKYGELSDEVVNQESRKILEKFMADRKKGDLDSLVREIGEAEMMGDLQRLKDLQEKFRNFVK